jgi:hypothetical protein
MRTLRLTATLCTLALLAACGSTPAPKTAEAPAKSTPPPVPPEITAVAESALGREAEVVVFGDLAHSGSQQVLVIDRLPKTPPGVAPGTLVKRVVIVENDAGKWKEVFHCDEYLKNTNGFLGGTPIVPVTGWRLQYEQGPQKGLMLYFRPLELAGSSHPPMIGIGWNPKVKRYQSLDRNFEHFLGESPSLEKYNSTLR